MTIHVLPGFIYSSLKVMSSLPLILFILWLKLSLTQKSKFLDPTMVLSICGVVDAAAITWFEKHQPLWKPNTKKGPRGCLDVGPTWVNHLGKLGIYFS